MTAIRIPMALTAALAVSALTAAAPALACACCSDTGERIETRAAFTSGEREQFLAARYAATAALFANAGFPETVRGIAAPIVPPYRLRATATGTALRFDLVDAAGKGGTIVLPLPKRLERFAVDLREEEEGGTGPSLYQEWRIETDAALTGMLAAKAKRAKARLILQGRGNRCAGPAEFAHWTLILSAPGVAATFFGDLNPEDQPAER